MSARSAGSKRSNGSHKIIVSVGRSRTLYFNKTFTNSGGVKLQGGLLETSGTADPQAGARNTGHGTISTAGLSSQGSLQLSGGHTSIYGPVSLDGT